jgi:anti-sigma B factor antagonist/stage II sporulation protein AA (anti-sigma F factor antagonist)
MIAAKQMRGRGARIAVAALQPVVAEIFAISRFDSVLEVFPSVREALAKVSPAALAAFEAQ